MATLITLFNRLIPFATPGTPLLQDLLHLTVLCATLYFGPQIQQILQRNQASTATINEAPPHDEHVNANLDARPVNGAETDAPANPNAGRPDTDRHQHALEDVHPAIRDVGHDAAEVAEAGPAHIHPHAAQDMARQRNVGSKKAKSLARKDQRRAYHEFQRAQGDSQRAKDAEGSEAREQALAAERERRKQAESQLEAQKAAEREAKRKKDESAREENAKRIDFVLQTIREELDAHRMCDLFRVARAAGDDVDEEWVEQVLKASGIIGMRNGTMTIITETGWTARVTMADMMNVYHPAASDNIGDEEGRITDQRINELLVAALKQHSGIIAS